MLFVCFVILVNYWMLLYPTAFMHLTDILSKVTCSAFKWCILVLLALCSTKCLCKDAEEQYLVCYCTLWVNMVHCGIVFIHLGQGRTGFSQGFFFSISVTWWSLGSLPLSSSSLLRQYWCYWMRTKLEMTRAE